MKWRKNVKCLNFTTTVGCNITKRKNKGGLNTFQMSYIVYAPMIWMISMMYDVSVSIHQRLLHAPNGSRDPFFLSTAYDHTNYNSSMLNTVRLVISEWHLVINASNTLNVNSSIRRSTSYCLKSITCSRYSLNRPLHHIYSEHTIWGPIVGYERTWHDHQIILENPNPRQMLFCFRNTVIPRFTI